MTAPSHDPANPLDQAAGSNEEAADERGFFSETMARKP